jgi:hypothetical protein
MKVGSLAKSAVPGGLSAILLDGEKMGTASLPSSSSCQGFWRAVVELRSEKEIWESPRPVHVCPTSKESRVYAAGGYEEKIIGE